MSGRAGVRSTGCARSSREPDLSPGRLEQLLAVMELRSGSCPTIGDLWAYRSVVERALKRPAQDVTYSLTKARELGASNLENLAAPSESTPKVVDDFDPRAPVRDKWAIVVGVGTFKDSRVRALSLASKDARDVTAIITNPDVGRFRNENVRTLLDDEATLPNIRKRSGGSASARIRTTWSSCSLRVMARRVSWIRTG